MALPAQTPPDPLVITGRIVTFVLRLKQPGGAIGRPAAVSAP
jgi:hypothetical protein